MTPQSFQEMIAHPNLPVMGLAEDIYLIPNGVVQFAGRIARFAQPLDFIVQGALVVLFWCMLVPLQVLLATFVVMPIRIISGRGEFGYNLMLWAVAAAPIALFAYFFGFDDLMRLLRLYIFWR
jgi:hypothetical protein